MVSTLLDPCPPSVFEYMNQVGPADTIEEVMVKLVSTSDRDFE
jgi:hypothetical protein